jgi:hypothetical protein
VFGFTAYPRNVGWFKRAFSGRLPNLVTCVVDRDGEAWEVAWASEGRVPDNYKDHSLTAIAERAAAHVADMYSGDPQAASAELQFAIYPWKGNPGKVILDVSRDAEGFLARDIQGTEIAIQGASLEDLVQKAETMLPNPSDAMFRWIRRVSELQKN